MENSEINASTICAISTPAGVGGIAVIRVSGPHAFECVSKCWEGKQISEMQSHTAHLGKITQNNGDILDEVVLTIFKAPRTFTGEDVLEISCHGSLWIQQELVRRLIDCGCTAARGGEFTQRAFANHRIDLSQAEAIADVIAAQSQAAHKIAMSQMRGDFSKQLNNLREQLLTFVSLIELELDFSEEEVEFANRDHLLKLANEIHALISRLANSFSTGNAIKNGIPVAIIGQTNAGKSTLLNLLLHDDRALVSDVHGTTRDVIEDTITINGHLFRFIDTAGLRKTDDIVETMGIERTNKKLAESQLILWIIDGTNAHTLSQLSNHIIENNNQAKIIAVINKTDLLSLEEIAKIETELKQCEITYEKIIPISAAKHLGIEQLQHAIINATQTNIANESDVIVTNARHYQALTNAQESIARAINGLKSGISGDFVSQDIRECLHYLGEITGEITTTDILSTIFSRFCIGK